ncbi:enhancer of mRNA-decapping protein 4 homolog isoform X2 [Topomyia yanbarensis]|nr:enhancer of mRNA-decapping protein 4 homolog isoform X2 [Topomyia yanbarensis]
MDKMGKTTSAGSTASATIVFNKDEKQHCFDINGRSVTVVGSVGKHDHGSSKVKLKNIVDYKWEQRNYPGRLIACHNEGKLIAYAITVNHRATPEGMVRIVHLSLGQRALIKGMSGEVLDLQFAHSSSKILLGVIEQIALHVYQVEIVNEKIICSKLLKVNDPIDGHVPLCDKISWCPYLQDSGYEDQYASQLLVWTRGDIFQCYSISTVVQHYGSGEIAGKDISEGGFKFRDALPVITGAIFSADGTTLAISCEDGVIRFYQVYQHTNESNPRCLHQWKPHGGKTISSFFFLDNYTEQAGDQTLWQHAITCSDNNTEIKVWSCETWECTQMIKFALPIDQSLCFKAEIDATSSYLVLSDMSTRELYVLQVCKETCSTITNGKSCEESYTSSKLAESKTTDQNNTATSTVSSTVTSVNAITRAYISSIAEFPLSSPILSFGILDVAVRMFKTNDAYLIEELDDYDEENSALYCVVIRMYLVQPKSVQECHLFYQPNVAFGTVVRSTISSVSSEYRNISQSSTGSTNKDERGNNVSSLMDMINKNANNTLVGEGTEGSLNASDKGNKSQSKETEELNKILSPVAVAAVLSTSTEKIIQPKQTVNLMTPDSFNSTSDKTDMHINDETVNPNVLNTLLMLANVTKQQQQLNNSVTSPNESLKEKPSPLNMLNIVNSTMIEEQEQAKVRQSVELQQAVSLETPPVPPMPSTEMLASGGSSPSREVQEILSLKDNDCLNEYYDSDNILLDETDGIGADDDELNDLENEIIDDEEDDDRYNFKNIDDDDDEDEIQQRSVQPTQKSGQKLSEVKPINQDQPPLGFVKSEPVHDKVNKNESASSGGWPKVPEVPHPPQNNFITAAQPPPPQPPMIVTVPQNSKQLDEITQKMDLLLDIVQTQSRQITELRTQIHDLNKTRSEDAQRYQSVLNKLDTYIPKKIDECFTRNDRQHAAKMEASIIYQNRQFRDGLMQALPQMLNTQIVERLTPTIIAEIQRFVAPRIGAQIEQMTHLIKMDVGAKLNNSDVLFRTTMEKMCRTQTFLDTMSTAVQAGVRKTLERTFHESIRNVMLPGYEKFSQELFRQLNTAFSAGTKEYVQKMDQHMAQNKQVTDRTNELIELVQKVPEQVNSSSDRQFKTNTAVLREDITRDFKLLQTNLLKVMRENIRCEIEKGLEAQASSLEDSVLSAVRSQAQTPAPSNVDIQEQIRQLLAHGHINKAFHKALLSNDLSLVDYTLEKADYKQVFSPCPLEQTVLLSLIQQISADMVNHNELKHRYLSDSIVSLNFMDPITKEHAPKVMRELNQNCQNYLSANPGNSLATSMKMLLIAIQGLGFKSF